jgi:hypothetical protein
MSLAVNLDIFNLLPISTLSLSLCFFFAAFLVSFNLIAAKGTIKAVILNCRIGQQQGVKSSCAIYYTLLFTLTTEIIIIH